MKKIKFNKRIDKNKIKKIIILVVLIILIIFLYNIVKLIIKPTDTFMVENGSIYIEESNVGYIIRDEILIQGENYKNGISQIKSEGEKVAKGDPIFRYYSNNEEKLIQNIAELDEKIQEALEEQNNVFPGDIKLLDKQIEEKIAQMRETNDLNSIKNMLTSIC